MEQSFKPGECVELKYSAGGGLKMIIDELKIPSSTENAKPYTCSQFALSFYQFLKKMGLQPVKELKGNTIFITLEWGFFRQNVVWFL